MDCFSAWVMMTFYLFNLILALPDSRPTLGSSYNKKQNTNTIRFSHRWAVILRFLWQKEPHTECEQHGLVEDNDHPR